jgi:hypothetical protein
MLIRRKYIYAQCSCGLFYCQKRKYIHMHWRNQIIHNIGAWGTWPRSHNASSLLSVRIREAARARFAEQTHRARDSLFNCDLWFMLSHSLRDISINCAGGSKLISLSLLPAPAVHSFAHTHTYISALVAQHGSTCLQPQNWLRLAQRGVRRRCVHFCGQLHPCLVNITSHNVARQVFSSLAS